MKKVLFFQILILFVFGIVVNNSFSEEPDILAPSIPQTLSATALSRSQIRLAWEPSIDNVGVAGYNIYRDSVLVMTVTGTDYTETGLSPLTTYTYTVTAFDAASNESPESESAQATTTEQMEVFEVSCTVATGSDDAEELDSGAVVLNSSDLELIADLTDQTVGIRFSAVNIPYGAKILSAHIEFTSDEVSTDATSLVIAVEDTGNASAYEAVSHNLSSRQVRSTTVEWPDVETWDNVGALHVTPDLSALVQGVVTHTEWSSGNAVSFMITGAGVRTAESYEGSVQGAPKLVVSYTLQPDIEAPSIPTNLSAAATSGTSIELSWDASTDDIIVTGYRIYRDGELVQIVSGTNYTDTGLLPLTSYTYTVTAIDSADHESTESESVQATTPQEQLEVFEISHTVATGDDDAEELDSGLVILDSLDLELIADLTDQTVGIRFNSVNIPYGAKILSAHIEFTTDEVSTAATSLVIAVEDTGNATAYETASHNLSSRQVRSTTVEWADIEAWDTAGVTHVTPNLSTLLQGVVTHTEWNAGNAVSFIITGAGVRTAESYDGSVQGAPKLVVSYTFQPDTSGPGIPANLSATAVSGTSIELSWDASVDDTAVTGYRIYRDGELIQTVTGTNYTDTGLTPLTSYTYTVTACDRAGNCSEEGVAVQAIISVENFAPVAAGQSLSVREDQSLVITLTGSDADNDVLTYEIVTAPSSGSLNGTAPNLTYIPDANFNGVDSFSFRVNDGRLNSDPATVSISVQPVNDIPTADAGTDQAVIRTANVSLSGNGSNDVDGDTLSYQWTFVSMPAGSTAVLSDSTSVNPDFIADMEGVYKLDLVVNDGTADSAADWVVISVSSTIVTVPSVVDLSYADAQTAIISAGLTEGIVTRVNSDVIPIDTVISQSPAGGANVESGAAVDLVVSLGPAPEVTITSAPDSIFAGDSSVLSWSSSNAQTCSIEPGIGDVSINDSIEVSPTETTTYTITATGPGGSITAQTVVTVENSAPVANSQILTSAEDQELPVTLSGSDVNNDTLSYEIITVPSFGSLGGTAPDLVYIPNPNYNGDDSFTFRVNDGQADSAIATISITVEPVNDTPIANAGLDQEVTQNSSVTLDGSGSNDIDADSLTYQWSFVSMPNGSAAVLSDATVVNPTFIADMAGVYELELIVNDGTVSGIPDTVSITVTPRMISVPLVVDLSYEDALAVITGAGLIQGSVTQEHSDTVPSNAVISQSPASGTEVAAGTAIDLVISSGPVSTGPSVTISADPESISIGGSALLSWSSVNAERAFIEPGIGVVAVNDSVNVTPEATTTYTITVTGAAGTSSSSVTIKVLGSPEELPEGAFGEEYQDLIPDDATIDKYDTNRFSLVTGFVMRIDGTPIESVNITILDHPEYGSTMTDEEGRFTIPVEGGGALVVAYEKEGLIPIQRKVYVPWNEYAVVDSVKMIVEDPVSTEILFDGNPESVFVHRSTPTSDQDGTRSATVIITGDNQAFATDKEGNDVAELGRVTLRVTEYPTPDSMPAALPPTSAFTYCAEFSFDGVKRVRFARPVAILINNFLGAQVGSLVPVGYYDRDRAVWVPEENAHVVMLVDTDFDGIVDGLDADGDNVPDDLNGNGSTVDEAFGLSDNGIYVPGQTYWWLETDHFTSIDCNYVKVSDDSERPQVKAPVADNQNIDGKDCDNSINSFVEERSRVFHEDVPIPGTDFTLHYSTNNVASSSRIINISLTGDTIPENLVNVKLNVMIAGKSHKFEFEPSQNLSYLFKWDGIDWWGRRVEKPVEALIYITYEYQGYYGSSYNDFINWFAKYPEERTGILMRARVEKWSSYRLRVLPPTYDPAVASYFADGWTISNHHHLSMLDPYVLLKGDGSKVSHFDPDYRYNRMNSAAFLELLELTSATNSGEDSSGEGDEGDLPGEGELEITFTDPQGIGMDAAGNIYVADTWNRRVVKVSRDGVATIIAGNGLCGRSPIDDSPGDKIIATDSPLYGPRDVCVDAAGNVYFTDFEYEGYPGVVRKIDTNGMLSNIPGSDILEEPNGIDVDDQGNLYIAHSRNHQILMIDPAGYIMPIAGTGAAGYSGDGGAAMQAQLNYPTDVKVDRQGYVYIADYRNHVIRRITPGGIIQTIAGTGNYGYSGDGGKANVAEFRGPEKIELDDVGNLYVVDSRDAIRKIGTNGIIQTIAGGAVNIYTDPDAPVGGEYYTSFTDLVITSKAEIFVSISSHDTLGKLGPVTPYLKIDSEDNNVYTENGLGYVIDPSGRHTKTIDLETGVTLRAFTYTTGIDGKRFLSSITDQFGNTTTIERDGNSVPTAIISPDGLRTQLTINAENYLTEITFPDASHYSFEYSPGGLMELEIDPNGNRFTHIFSEYGKLLRVQDENGGDWQYDRQVLENGSVLTIVTSGEGNQRSYLDNTDEAGLFTSLITDATGSQTSFSESGLIANKTTACGMSYEFEYDFDPKFRFKYLKRRTESTPSGLSRSSVVSKEYLEPSELDLSYTIRETVAVNGKSTVIENSVFEAQRTITSPEGRTVIFNYDPNTLGITTASIPNLFDTSYEYDSQGRLISVGTNTRSVEYTYNSLGFLETFTDAGDNTTTYFYDEMGRIEQILRPDASSLWFDYDPNGNMTVLTNPSAISHGFGFNKVNLRESYQTPLSGNYSFLYDKDRRLIQKTFPSGKSIDFTYENGTLSQIQTPEGNIDYTYYCSSKIESITQGTESIRFEYDGKLLTSATYAGTLSQALEFDYNSDFNLVLFRYAGTAETYSYDNDGLMIRFGAFTVSRNALNGLPESVTGGSLTLSRIFNGYGELDSQSVNVGGQNVAAWDLDRNDRGQIISKSETVDGVTHSYSYTYDSMGRLLTVEKDGVLVEEYGYNDNGIRIYEMNSERGISGRTFVYSDEDHLLNAGSVQYAYDPDGFLTTKTDGSEITTYSYSTRGELLNVTLPNSTVIEYVHDPTGRRIAKKINGITVEKYLWQGLTRLLAVYDGNNHLMMRFEYADGRMPVAMEKEGVRYYLTYDQVGSLRLVSDASGNMVKKVDYDSFGNVLNDSAPSFFVPFGFAGGLHDTVAGLVRFGFRDYDPEIGRWTAKDPIQFAGGDTDLYGYVLNDPVNLVDPRGLYNELDYYLDAVTGDTDSPFEFEKYQEADRIVASEATNDLLKTTTIATLAVWGPMVGIGAISEYGIGFIAVNPELIMPSLEFSLGLLCEPGEPDGIYSFANAIGTVIGEMIDSIVDSIADFKRKNSLCE